MINGRVVHNSSQGTIASASARTFRTPNSNAKHILEKLLSKNRAKMTPSLRGSSRRDLNQTFEDVKNDALQDEYELNNSVPAYTSFNQMVRLLLTFRMR